MFKKIVSILFHLTEFAVLVLLATICVVMLTQIFSRYLFNTPLAWPEELSRYLFVWVVFLGAAIAFRYKAHLGMDFITARFSDKFKRITEKLVDLILLGFLILIIYIAPEILSITQFQTSPVLDIPMSYIYLSFPVSCGLMIIELMDRWVSTFRGEKY